MQDKRSPRRILAGIIGLVVGGVIIIVQIIPALVSPYPLVTAVLVVAMIPWWLQVATEIRKYMKCRQRELSLD